MKKKFLVSAVICVFVSALGLMAQEKVRVYEHLAFVQTGYGETILETYLDNPDYFTFQSGPFLSCSVPPSPKADAIFFEFWGQSIHEWWVGYDPQSFSANIKVKLVSNLIPPDIEVYWYHGLTGISGITHNSPGPDRNKRTWKFILRRDSMLRAFTDWWDIRFISTGQQVPNNVAQGILNNLMNNGFNVEISVLGNCQGVNYFSFYAFEVEVTRLVKKQ